MSAVAQRIPPLERTGGLSQARVMASEWTKLRSVRSTKWALAAAFVLTIGLPALAAAIVAHHWAHMDPRDQADFNSLDISIVGVQIAQLAIGAHR